MNTKEFSEQFDTLLDSYKLSNNYGTDENFYATKLDEYEKSVYLTKAQKDIVIELYSGKNLSGKSYEETEELRRYLDNLNSTIEKKDAPPTSPFSKKPSESLSKDSVWLKLSSDLMFLTVEQVEVKASNNCPEGYKWEKVIPIRRDEYLTIKDNPFKNKYIFRIDHADNFIELISKNKIKTYKAHYLRKPKPIILEDLDYLTIDGFSRKQECELNNMLHMAILERAVQSAYNYMATKINNTNE